MHATATTAVHSWLTSSLGRSVLQAESELMVEALDDIFGWELLQLGLWGPSKFLLTGCRTRSRAVIANDKSRCAESDITARLSQLPIGNGAVDAVVLPHTLEFETDPFAVVREADRVLAGEGHLVVLGFRPFSLWGFRSRAISRGYPPGLKRMLGARRVADWLELLGYDVGITRNYLFTPPWGGSAPRPDVPSALLRRGWIKPWPAGAYLLKARKRVYTITPIRPRSRERQPIGGLVKPTPRASS
jgi:SAM-dependent methyltransferase